MMYALLSLAQSAAAALFEKPPADSVGQLLCLSSVSSSLWTLPSPIRANLTQEVRAVDPQQVTVVPAPRSSSAIGVPVVVGDSASDSRCCRCR